VYKKNNNIKNKGSKWFDEIPTFEARNEILSSVVEIFPFLEDSQLIHQTACLRPLTIDKLPIISQSNIYS
jgi:glycine/D-amino acid oxidase-like deaminating enzyme